MSEIKAEPLVSVLMPVYNAGIFLRAAIDSILNQEYRNFELLLVNDGSTDDSERIILSYNDSRIQYISQHNSGVAASLNNAITKVKGIYIWRHDADDICLPGKLGLQVRFLEDHPEFALCATQIAFMTETGKIAWGFRQPGNTFFNHEKYREVERRHFNPYSPITHATVLIRTEVMKQMGGYRTAFQTAEDVDLWLRILQYHKAAVLNECNYFVRLNRTSATQKHGWKNEFFRNLAFACYEQRVQTGEDDLQKGLQIVLPDAPARADVKSTKGSDLRSDLVSYLLPLHLNAKDYRGSWKVIRYALRDGWKLSATWKLILFALMGKNMVQRGVAIKRMLK